MSTSYQIPIPSNLNPTSQDYLAWEKANFILRQIQKTTSNTTGQTGTVTFTDEVSMSGNQITSGPPQTSLSPTDYVTKSYFSTTEFGQLVDNLLQSGGKTPLNVTGLTGAGGSGGGGAVNTTAPLQGGGTPPVTLTITQAGASTDGYLSSADWNTFNGKQSALSFGNLTEVTSSILTIVGGTGAVIGSGVTIAVTQASAGTSGWLSSTDWTTFNGKMSNPMSVLGDIIYGGSGGTPTRLAAGAAGKVLQGGSTPSWGSVVETNFAFTDIATANSTTSQHGLLPKLSGGTTQFLRGDGTWVTPSGATNAYTTVSFSGQTSVTVTHSFGAYPAVQIIDNNGYILEAKNIQHTSLNAFTVTFQIATTGTIIVTLGSPQAQAIKIVSGNYPIVSTDRIIQCSAANATITLPSAVTYVGFNFTIDNSSNGYITVASGAGLIEGQSTQSMPSNTAMDVYSDGTNWRIH